MGIKTSTSFKPGQTGNSNGRPKKEHSITQTIRDMMDEKPEIKRALSSKILEMAMKGDITAMKTLWNYMDGMPQQGMDLNIKDFKKFIIESDGGQTTDNS